MRNLLGACAVLSKPTLLVAFTVLQIEVEESVSITDHKGNEQGRLQVRLLKEWKSGRFSETQNYVMHVFFLSFLFLFHYYSFIYL